MTESSDNETICSLFSLRAEYDDIKPIYPREKAFQPFQIHYSEEYLDLMSYFRAVLESNEKSKRALEIVSKVILKNPSNFVAWDIRKRVGFIENELEFIEMVLDRNVKSYQLWNHLKSIEIYVDKNWIIDVLKIDERNFQAWSYLRWWADHFGKKEDGIAVTEYFLDINPLNGSSLNTRSILFDVFFSFEEFSFALSILYRNSKNYSVCAYIRHIYQYLKFDLQYIKEYIENFPHSKNSEYLDFLFFQHAKILDDI